MSSMSLAYVWVHLDLLDFLLVLCEYLLDFYRSTNLIGRTTTTSRSSEMTWPQVPCPSQPHRILFRHANRMLALYFLQWTMICCMVVFLESYTLTKPYSYTPADRIDARLYFATYSFYHAWYLAMWCMVEVVLVWIRYLVPLICL